MKRVFASALLIAVSVVAPSAQAPQAADAAQLRTAALEIIKAARYCTLATIASDGQPQARIVDPFAPEPDLTIWIATNADSRKVDEIRRDPRVTLLYFNAANSEFVTVIGAATIVADPKQKAAHWKTDWATFYKDQNRGDDYILIRVLPSRFEVVSEKRGIRNNPKTWRARSFEVHR